MASRDELRLRAAHQKAIARPELRRGPFFEVFGKRASLPPAGIRVHVQAKDAGGVYELPMPVVYRDGKWINEKHDCPLTVCVVGWKPWGLA